MSQRLTDRAAWRVVIAAHELRWAPPGHPELARRWAVAACDRVMLEPSEQACVARALLEAHVEAGVPAYRSWLRRSSKYVVVERTVASVAGGY